MSGAEALYLAIEIDIEGQIYHYPLSQDVPVISERDNLQLGFIFPKGRASGKTVRTSLVIADRQSSEYPRPVASWDDKVTSPWNSETVLPRYNLGAGKWRRYPVYNDIFPYRFLNSE
jgi:hypothetical protein